jgi:hypothetical protein
MSWSVGTRGTKEKVAAEIAKQFDGAAASYDSMNPEEAKDIRACKERVLQAIEACDIANAGTDANNKPINGVNVSAYGSRSGLSMSMAVSVGACHVEEAP